MVGPGVGDAVAGYLDWIFVAVLGVDGDVDLLGEDLELVDGGGTIDVTGHEQGALGLLALEFLGKLARECRLTRALQTRHQDDRRVAREVDLSSVAAHERGELVVDNLDHQLLRLDGVDDVLTQGLLLDGVGKLLCHLVVHIGIKQGATHVLEGLGHVNLGDFTLAFKYFKTAFESFA